MADLDLVDPLDEPGLEVLAYRVLHQKARRRGAAFAVDRVDHENHRIERTIELSVVEDDDRVLAAELEMGAFEGIGALLHDHRAGAAFADEGDGLDVGMLGQRFSRVLGGRLTDWGAHLIDLAQWANDSEETGPVEVEGTGEFPPRDALFNTASQFDVTYKYANGVTLQVASSRPGIRFEGADGWIAAENWRGPLTASDQRILESEIGNGDTALYRPRVVIARQDPIGGEHRNFIDCVKTRTPCYAPAETGHRTITVAHIGNIAMMLGRKLRWDPDAERFVGDVEANKMLSREQREPWTIDNTDSWLKTTD